LAQLNAIPQSTHSVTQLASPDRYAEEIAIYFALFGSVAITFVLGVEDPGETAPERHWSFRSPARTVIPRIVDIAWPRNEIDSFIAAAHDERGLRPVAPAEKHVLLRRVYLDLVGLPPTRDELHAFLDDESPDAYEKVVDRLLESPHYGERWGKSPSVEFLARRSDC
jgi:hypothetical protein